jgi:hypothetical protein
MQYTIIFILSIPLSLSLSQSETLIVQHNINTHRSAYKHIYQPTFPPTYSLYVGDSPSTAKPWLPTTTASTSAA